MPSAGKGYKLHEYADHRAGGIVKSVDTDLSRAVTERNLAKLEKLLKKGANPNEADCSGQVPLHRASYFSDDAAVKVLLKSKDD